MSNKTLAIGAVFITALIVGIFATTPIYGDESETKSEINVKQEATGSGNTDIEQCADSAIGSTQSEIGGECKENDSAVIAGNNIAELGFP
jgi:Na+(H+)/acetate symporter ActP